MSGNVEEWVHDWESCTYEAGNQVNPTGAASNDSDNRMTRGGWWDTTSVPGRWCRTAARKGHGDDFGSQKLGFRVARSGN